MATTIVTSFLQLCDSNGVPLASGSVKVCSPGTTTPLSVFSDTGLSVSALNPINLTAARHDMRYIATGAYKIIVYTSADGAGSVLFTRDNIDPGVPVGTGALAVANGGTGATTEVAALASLGAATAAELAVVTAEVATLSGQLASTEKTHIATGTTAQRSSSPAAGDIRHNTTTGKFEAYIAAWWNSLTTQDIAAQSDMETATSTTTVVTPGRVQNHPGVAKAWVKVTGGGTPVIAASHNVSSITDNGVGDFTINFTTAFSSANYAAMFSTRDGAASTSEEIRVRNATAPTASAIRINTYVNSAPSDSISEWYGVFFGDQ